MRVDAGQDGGVGLGEELGGAGAPRQPGDEEEDGERNGGGPVGAQVFGEEGVRGGGGAAG